MLESEDIDTLKSDIQEHNGHRDVVKFVEVANNISNQQGDPDEYLEKLWELSRSDDKEVSDIVSNYNKVYQRHLWNNGVSELQEDPGSFDVDINSEKYRQLRMIIERVYDLKYN